MSAPDTTDITATTEADPPSDAVGAPTRRQRLRPHGPLIAGIAALTVAAVVLATMLVSGHLDREAALSEIDAARADAAAASAELRAAQHARTASMADLEQLLATADEVAAITGAGIDATATQALVAARAPIELPQLEPAAITPAGTLDLDSARPASMRSYAHDLTDYAARLDAMTDDENAVATEANAGADALTSALTAYTAATVAAGGAVFADRADASDDVEAALQSTIETLPTASAAELPGAITAYRLAVDAVVASSDRARAPASSGPIGSGADDPTSLTVVVNKSRALPSEYAPSDLRRPAGVGNTLPLRAVAAAAAERMAADMAAVGIQLRMSSGYRSFSRQQTLYNGFVAREGVAGADEHSARPGHSEHQTGLAADFDDGTGCNLKVCFQNTAGGSWLAENAWRYGFILRYGDGWQPTVGYRFEPWHYRFVGETAAADMHDRGILTLEEYFGLPASPDYS